MLWHVGSTSEIFQKVRNEILIPLAEPGLFGYSFFVQLSSKVKVLRKMEVTFPWNSSYDGCFYPLGYHFY
jgi:hypothetical protein